NVEAERPVLVTRSDGSSDPVVFVFRVPGDRIPRTPHYGWEGSAARSPSAFATICHEVQLWDGTATKQVVRKPAIYLYPERPQRVSVRVELAGRFLTQYPKPLDGAWTMSATEDGDLTDPATGRSYPYLFWEGVRETPFEIDPAQAHCICREEAAA